MNEIKIEKQILVGQLEPLDLSTEVDRDYSKVERENGWRNMRGNSKPTSSSNSATPALPIPCRRPELAGRGSPPRFDGKTLSTADWT